MMSKILACDTMFNSDTMLHCVSLSVVTYHYKNPANHPKQHWSNRNGCIWQAYFSDLPARTFNTSSLPYSHAGNFPIMHEICYGTLYTPPFASIIKAVQ